MTTFSSYAPGDLVATGGEGDKTWTDLQSAAVTVAFHLSHLPSCEVVLACDDRFHFAAALLGAMGAGARVVLPPNTQRGTLEALAADGRRLLLHDRVEEPAGQRLQDWLERTVRGSLVIPGHDRDVVLVMTSGSTGAPQAFPKTLGQLMREVETQGDLFQVGPEARLLVMAPPHHIYGLLFGILLPLRSGAAFVRHTALHGEGVAEAVRRQKVTHVVSVPAQLRALAEFGPLPHVRRVFSSAAPLPPETASRLAKVGWPVTEIYGSTETGGVGFREGAGAWRALPGVGVALDDEGRLTVDSPFLHPAQERPFVTGDLARLTDRGFELLGRWDGVVKVGGKRVTLREVEMLAARVSGVNEVAALSRVAPGGRGEEIWLVVAGSSFSASDIRQELARWLDPTALPRRIRVVDALPREDTGKITRARLLSMFEKAGDEPREKLD